MLMTSIRCDNCGKIGEVGRPPYRKAAHLMRYELKQKGWRCIERNGKDYCPDCKESME